MALFYNVCKYPLKVLNYILSFLSLAASASEASHGQLTVKCIAYGQMTLFHPIYSTVLLDF